MARRWSMLQSGALLIGPALALAACASLETENPNMPHYWLEQALTAVKAHDSKTALADIDKAEALWEGSNVPFSDTMFGFDPDAMREMARARQAVQAGQWGDAEYYVRTAATHPSTVTPP